MIRLKPPKFSIPITQRIIAIPLIAIMIGVLGISYTASLHLKSTLLKQMKDHAIQVSVRLSDRTQDHLDALSTIDTLLADKVHLVGSVLLENRNRISNDYLREVAKQMGVGETNWYSPEGQIVYSTVDAYVGWRPSKNHPVDYFMGLDQDLWIEALRKDSESQELNKYGYLRDKDGSFVQIAIPADFVEPLTARFSYQGLMDEMVADGGLVYAAMLNRDFQLLSRANIKSGAEGLDQDQLVVGKILGAEGIPALKKGETLMFETIKGRVFEVYVPVMDQGKMERVLALAFDMSGVNRAVTLGVQGIIAIGIIMVIVIGGLLGWLQRRQIVSPIQALQSDTMAISIEGNILYRLPTAPDDPFFALRNTTNHVLDMTQQYFEEMIENQEELTAANEELEATIGQLTASEEELRAQYDEIQEYAEKVAQLKSRYTLAIEATESYIWEYEPLLERISFSNNFTAILGQDADYLDVNEVAERLIHFEDREAFLNAICGDIQHLNVRIMGPSGDWQWFMLRGKRVSERPMHSPLVAGVLVDVSKQKAQELYIQYLAEHDALTGLMSRRRFSEMVESEVNLGHSGAVLLMDIDNFKNINDSLGHVYGDKVLKHIADLLVDYLHDRGNVFRFGGDEFLIQVKAPVVIAEIEAYLNQLMSWFTQNTVIEGVEQRITISTGIAIYPDDDTTVEGLLMKADVAMYSAKRAGKNQYRQFSEDMSLELRDKIRVEQILRKAYQQDGFMLHYQPVIETSSGDIAYFEALIRLKDCSVSPAVCIAVAEETGLIQGIGRWVIAEAISQIAKWLENGRRVKPVAINISPKQMYDQHLVSYIAQKLKRFNVDPGLIEIEITENVLVENRQETLEILHQLKHMGMTIALDDFGTGYSSLNYLTFIPVDKIKLDKSLKDKFIHLEDIQVMASLIALAHGLHLKVVAEGVEEPDEFATLKACGSDYVQGYLFSKPLSARDTERVLLQGLTDEGIISFDIG